MFIGLRRRLNFCFHPFILDAYARECRLIFVVITDLDKCRPQFERRLNLADYVVHDPRYVLLKKVRLEPIERPR